MRHKEIESIQQFNDNYSKSNEFNSFAFQNIDFTLIEEKLAGAKFDDCLFLGCKIPEYALSNLQSDNYIFPQLDVPYNCYPAQLYSSETLYASYKIGVTESYKQTFDYKVYKHYLKTGKEAFSINETLARRIHDHAITDAMYDFIAAYEEKKVVAVMGGHALDRTGEAYKTIALLSKILSERGYLMVTGGGPGAMEAAHLGAWFAESAENELNDAFKMLSTAPTYKHKEWLDSAFKVIKKYPRKHNFESLGIPTWLYGHEPATPFATMIAKYFANSVREDGLLTIAKGGVIFSPGSAGTVQEVFQDATQNHYLSFGYASPMIFLGKEFWLKDLPVYAFLEQSVASGKYNNLLLSATDEICEIVKTLEDFSNK